ncbi:MAG: hypothetical protein IT438_09515 [Phycisphaerales bacterium]|nr:hypothetical protein [Phycisphaerales bacterium]
MSQLLASFSALPRSAKWIVASVVVLVAYFLIIEPVLDRTNRFAGEADALERSLTRAYEIGSDSSDDGKAVLSATQVFGRPRLPTDSSLRPESIQRVVDEILDTHNVEDANKRESSATLQDDTLSALKPSEGRFERYIVEVSFDATQETVAHVLADLERSPSVSAISRVRIDRSGFASSTGRAPDSAETSGPRLVRATIAAESWVFIPQK